MAELEREVRGLSIFDDAWPIADNRDGDHPRLRAGFSGQLRLDRCLRRSRLSQCSCIRSESACIHSEEKMHEAAHSHRRRPHLPMLFGIK